MASYVTDVLPLLGPHLPLLAASTAFFFTVDAATPYVCELLFPDRWNRYHAKVRRDWGIKVTCMALARMLSSYTDWSLCLCLQP